MKPFPKSELWLVVGSQHLYGEGPLRQVAANGRAVAEGLDGSGRISVKLLFKALVTTPDEVADVCRDANADPACAGLVLWMHTFSPAKMWIRGLTALRKPFLHLHTQFNRDLPWNSIDMDFMNLNQAAHGDREAGFMHTRMRLGRKVVVGHWKDPEVQDRIDAWARAARAWQDWQGARVARIGDNMREVSVTEGDKVAAEARFGFSVNGYGVGDVAQRINAAGKREVDALLEAYEEDYSLAPALRRGGAKREALEAAARIEAGLRSFLSDTNASAFTTTFEDLHGLRQLPGLAPQRLMAEGIGFAAEGDWKTAALLRAMKVMGEGLPGGTSFMEDYTYHLDPKGHQVLGAHMLEICPSIAAGKPRAEVHPLGIGGKEDPVRLVFSAQAGPALNASLVDLGNRFRLLVNEVKAVKPKATPKLPVACAVWECLPDFKAACQCWILAGGAHHTGYSQQVSAETLEDFATIAGLECVMIGADTRVSDFKQTLRTNEVYYHLAQGIHA
ncbi:MAG: L-arabinose isomerase [Opitutaceae bacterium]|nr:L-arabinose isomerase [Opitutaceae bacterium]